MADSNLAVNASLPASYILDFYSIILPKTVEE